MGGISDEHLEWAVVNRLKRMLEHPPETKFNVTQSFALFSTILLWSKNRVWVAGNDGQRRDWQNLVDHRAHDAREALRCVKIIDEPWRLSTVVPRMVPIELQQESFREDRPINLDFVEVSAESFFKWLRDALAHGDGRTIRPMHKPSRRGNRTLLAGFEVAFPERQGSSRHLTLALYHLDIKRIGVLLADLFCQSLSDSDRYFDQDAATASIEEAA